ncbi:MAG: cell division protein FtsL [Burkholderiales bacterium]
MRLNLVLLIAVLASALYLVHVQYQSRRLVFELETVNAATAKLEVELSRLQVERRGEATSLRVESLASQRLQMTSATPAITLYVDMNGLPLPTASASIASAAVPASRNTVSKQRGSPP